MWMILLWALVSIWSIFGLVVMLVVLQAAIPAREYYERKNREHHNRPIHR